MNAKPRIIIVCHVGMSTSETLRSKIVTNFYVDVKGTFSVRKAEIWLEKNEVDLIISTVEFIHQTIPSIHVNPYLSKNDKNLIQNELRQVTVPVNIDQLIKTIEKNAVIENKIELKKDLNSYFGITRDINESKGVYQPMLQEVLNEDTVSVNVECSNRNEAVIESGKLLVKAGYAEERYIQAMIDNVLKNGTYIVIAPGIAIPHARPEEGAKEIGLSIVTLKEPVVFGHPTNDPVKIVIGLCAVDHQTHLKALSELVDILGDSLKVKKLNKAENTKEVMEIIKGGN
ncbi:PTS sugar transporter subunit IIA [Alkalibacterium sp. s-m-28]